MPRFAGYRRPTIQGTDLTLPPFSKQNNVRLQQTNVRRHDYSASNPDIGSPTALTGGEYFGVVLAKFKRSFSGVVDTPPTPTDSNNYQTPEVFNGSSIQDLQAQIRLTNGSTTNTAVLTVYKVALSFYDGYVWNSFVPANSPVTYATTALNGGEVDEKAVLPLALSENLIYNKKFLQHYCKKVGEITLGQEGSGKETVELNFKGIPSKCKRSQTGMYYAYFFVNDSDKNEGRALSMDYAFNHHFVEIPSENRLPFLP